MDDTVLIFDFDGTIADTLHFVLHISNRLADEFGYKRIHTDEIEFLKDKPSREVVKYVGIPHYKIPTILAKAHKEFSKGVTDVHPVPGLREVLHQLRRLHRRLGVLSSNSVENIQGFLRHHDLELFDFIHHATRLWGKNHALKKLIAENGLQREKVLYIGDEARDVVAAQKAGVKSVAVTWGFNSEKALRMDQPDFVVNEPNGLLDLLTPGARAAEPMNRSVTDRNGIASAAR